MNRVVAVFVLLAFAGGSFSAASGQDQDRVRHERLQGLIRELEAAGPDAAENVLARLRSASDLSPVLDSIVGRYTVESERLDRTTTGLTAEQGRLDLKSRVIHLEGVVEAQVKGHAVVNSAGSFFAVQGSFAVGSTFKGYLKEGSATISYKPLGSDVRMMRTYVPSASGSPQERAASISKQLEQAGGQRRELWRALVSASLGVLRSERTRFAAEVIERHYAEGERFFQAGRFDSAAVEFAFVQSLDPAFREVATRLAEAANDNQRLKTADVFRIVTPEPGTLIAGTSDGIARSTNGGRSWNVIALAGSSVKDLDAVGTRILAHVESASPIVYSDDLGNTWKALTVQYRAVFGKQHNPQTGGYSYQSFPVVQPDYTFKRLRLVASVDGEPELLFLEYTGREGVFGEGDRALRLKKNLLNGQYSVNVGGEAVAIPEKCFSPDGGTTWIPYYKALLGDNYYVTQQYAGKVGDWIDLVEDYCEYPGDAVDNVLRYVSKNVSNRTEKVVAIAHSDVRKAKKADADPVLVLTNYGLYRTGWDREEVVKLDCPLEGEAASSVGFDPARPEVIVVGLRGGGMLVSGDGGATWGKL